MRERARKRKMDHNVQTLTERHQDARNMRYMSNLTDQIKQTMKSESI